VTDLTFADPCVVFALRHEATPFLRGTFRPQQRFRGAPCRARFCGPSWLSVLVLETGLGLAAVEAALTWALSSPLFGRVPYRPKLVLSAGFSGALRPGLRVGDLVLATEVLDLEGNRWPATWPGELPPGEWRPPLTRGRLLTVPGPAATPGAKRALGERLDALAADMESAAVARLCQKYEVPFGCLRVISDDWDTPLSPQLVGVLKRGRVAPLRLAAALARHPTLVRELWRLARHTRAAARQLAVGLGELLTLTLPSSPD
jgi:adenosylhomocysteine nucleosidase